MAEDAIVKSDSDKKISEFRRGYIMLYNPKQGSEINDIHAKKVWNHKINQIKAYPKEFAEYLKAKYGFLQEIAPERLKDIKKLMKDKDFKCPYCDFETDNQRGLDLHIQKKHKIDDETKEVLDAVEVVNVGMKPVKGESSPEGMENIPDTSRGNVTDRDGVEWYGEGYQDDVVKGSLKKTSNKMFGRA